MKSNLIAVCLLSMLLSCGTNQNSEKESKLNERELELKNKELALKQRQYLLDSINGSKQAPSKPVEDKSESKKPNNNIQKAQTLTAKFKSINNSLVLKVNNKEFVIQRDFGETELHEGGLGTVEAGTIATCSVWGVIGGTDFAAILRSDGSIKVEQNALYRVQGVLNSEKSTIRIINKSEY